MHDFCSWLPNSSYETSEIDAAIQADADGPESGDAVQSECGGRVAASRPPQSQIPHPKSPISHLKSQIGIGCWVLGKGRIRYPGKGVRERISRTNGAGRIPHRDHPPLPITPSLLRRTGGLMSFLQSSPGTLGGFLSSNLLQVCLSVCPALLCKLLSVPGVILPAVLVYPVSVGRVVCPALRVCLGGTFRCENLVPVLVVVPA